jgi:drug/metabolite transporter (DMT)-like permease
MTLSLSFSIPSALALLLLGAIWGCAFLFIRWAVDSFPPCTLVAFRLFFGLVPLGLLLLVELIRQSEQRTWIIGQLLRGRTILDAVFMGLFNNALPFIFVAASMYYITSSVAAVIDSAIPIFAQLFATLYFRIMRKRSFRKEDEPITFRRILGLSVGFAGVILVCLLGFVNKDTGFNPGYLLVVIATASYGLSSTYAKIRMDADTYVIRLGYAFLQVFFGFFWSFAGLLFYEIPTSQFRKSVAAASQRAWLSLLYLGLASTAVAYLLYFYLISAVGSVRQASVGYLLPVFGILVGALVLGEWDNVSPLFIVVELVGTVMILFGISQVMSQPLAEKSSIGNFRQSHHSMPPNARKSIIIRNSAAPRPISKADPLQDMELSLLEHSQASATPFDPAL